MVISDIKGTFLNVKYTSYNDHALYMDINALLVSSSNSLLYVGADQKEIYFNWAYQHMEKIPNVSCDLIDTASQTKEGRCYYNEEQYECEDLWS